MSFSRSAEIVLERFPKTRSELPASYQKIYAEHYQSNRSGDTGAASLSQKMERWLHHRVAADVCGRDGHDLTTLEIGAGSLNHLQYEPASEAYDVIEPFEELWKNSPQVKQVRRIYRDLSEVPDDQRYDRITSVAVFEHLTELPRIAAEAALKLNAGGCLRTAIPSEGTWLWTLGWMATTGVEFLLRYGLDYGRLMRHEHVNTAKEIEVVLKSLFDEVTVCSFGLGRACSFYQYIGCRKPSVEQAKNILKMMNKS